MGKVLAVQNEDLKLDPRHPGKAESGCMLISFRDGYRAEGGDMLITGGLLAGQCSRKSVPGLARALSQKVMWHMTSEYT